MANIYFDDTPSAQATTQFVITPLPSTPDGDPLWLMILTGIAIPNLKGTTIKEWTYQPFVILPDLQRVVDYANLGPPTHPNDWFFQVDQYTTLASLNSIFDKDLANNMGFAVDATDVLYDAAGVKPGLNLLRGMEVWLAVRDNDAELYRVGYQITAIGRFVQALAAGIL